MRFNSLAYLVFLALVVLVLWLIPRRVRPAWLLLASWTFYASWHWPYLLLLIAAATLNWAAAPWIAIGPSPTRRGAVVVGANLLLLGLFKYLDWLVANANSAASFVGVDPLPLPGWVLPLGISFYLFQCISYIIDVSRGRERSYGFWQFQLYIAYFPQLIAGPIMRAKEFFPQLSRGLGFDANRLRQGITDIILGLFTKVVLADGIAADVDAAYSRSPDALGSGDVWLMAVAFGLQIYFDFSAYSRMAIGSAKLCNIDLVQNFHFPYSAMSPVDFWNRWHMSLSRWIRDYLFFPLAGSRPKLPQLVRAAFLSMALCGLWHGAGWTFVVWGLVHGAAIAGYHGINHIRRHPRFEALPRIVPTPVVKALGACLTFGVVTLAWLFFRCETVATAGSLAATALTPGSHTARALPGSFYLTVIALALATVLAPTTLERVGKLSERLVAGAGRPYGRAAVGGVALGMLASVSLIYMRDQKAFIYFQF